LTSFFTDNAILKNATSKTERKILSRLLNPLKEPSMIGRSRKKNFSPLATTATTPLFAPDRNRKAIKRQKGGCQRELPEQIKTKKIV
jgi:hypothetical protein